MLNFKSCSFSHITVFVTTAPTTTVYILIRPVVCCCFKTWHIQVKIPQVLLISNQPNFLSFPNRTGTSACCTLKTHCSRLSQVKHWGIKATNPFILSSSTNVLITRRALPSPWREKGVWWFPPSVCRQSRSSKPTNRNLHQKKRSEDGLFFKTPDMMRLMWGWNKFYKNVTFIEMTADAWNTHVYAGTHSHTIFKCTIINRFSSQLEDEQHVHCNFTKAQSYSDICCYIYATVDSGTEQCLELKGWICKIQSDLSWHLSDHTQVHHFTDILKPCDWW